MNDLIVVAFAVIMLLAVLPIFLMNRAFTGAGRRKKVGGDASVAPLAGGDGPPMKSKTGHAHDDSGSDSAGDGGGGGGGGD